MPAIKDLRDHLRYLSAKRRLVQIRDRVSAELEITAYTDRAGRDGRSESKAMLFEKVEGYDIPVATNILGSTSTLRELFGGSYMGDLLSNLNKIKISGKGIDIIKGGRMLLNSKPRYSERKLGGYSKLSGLDELPILKVWPKDGGKFITQPIVITQSPIDGSINAGIYRMQVFDSTTTGMHWQAQKGGARHASEAKELGKPLPVSVVIGTDPYNVVSAIAPLPPGMNKFAFAGMARGASTALMKNGKYPPVPSNAEVILNGYVDPGETRLEGPFGDHTGYYTVPEPYPVFHIDEMYAKRSPVYAASVVGWPWHEDVVVAEFLSDFLKPVIKSMNESIVDFYLPPEGIFTNMGFVSIKKRFPGEAKKAMFAILGTGQLSFLKILIAFDDDINIRDFSSVMWALATRVEPQRDVQIIRNATADSLDFTTDLTAMGSKMLIDATRKTKEEGFPREWPEKLSLPKELVDEIERKWKHYS